MNSPHRLFGLPARGLDPFNVVRAITASRLLRRHRPFWVNVEVTHRCNLRCSFCDKRATAGEMSGSDARRLLHDLRVSGTASVCFDGGEPLVHPDIESIVAHAKELGLRVALSTNGTLLQRHRSVLSNVDAVKVSIDGPERIHDAGRGEGAFEGAIEGARAAQQAGVPVALRMTLARHNVEHWRTVADLARQLGVVALFQPAIGSVMNAFGAMEDHCADVAVYRRAMDEIARYKQEGGPVGNEIVCLEHLRRWPEATRVDHCAGGRVEVAVGPDGSMFPCGRVGRGDPAPNALELGAKEAFSRVRRPEGCGQCWCTLTLGNCYLYGLDWRLLRGRLRQMPHQLRDHEIGMEGSLSERRAKGHSR
jgi:MoaA/NifB/PqqE/SkfB family radical SAM enzyme